MTGTTGAVLLLLLAVEGVTILFLRPLLSVHVFVGMLLIPPVALKLASTCWRFVRYYTHSRPYVLLGPPRLLMRLLVAPVVVLSTARAARERCGAARRGIGRRHSAPYSQP